VYPQPCEEVVERRPDRATSSPSDETRQRKNARTREGGNARRRERANAGTRERENAYRANVSSRPSNATSTSGPTRRLVVSCSSVWPTWVRYAWRGWISAISSSASGTLRWVGCGSQRSASTTTTSRSYSSARDAAGTPLVSVK